MAKNKNAVDTKMTTVAPVPPTSIVPAVPNGFLMQAQADSGQGLENIKREDASIPFIAILQPLSPQVQEGTPQSVKDARPGMLLDTVTGEMFAGAEGMVVIPVHFEKKYIEWKPRAAGGGLVKVYNTREEAMAGQLTTTWTIKKDNQNVEVGTDIVDTAQHYILYRSAKDGSWNPALLSCKSTQLGFSRKWNALMQSFQLVGVSGTPFTPPTFAAMYLLTTARMQNDKGTWFGMKAERSGLVDDESAYNRAKSFRSALLGGEVVVKYDDPMVTEAVHDGPLPQDDDGAGVPF